MRSRTSVGCAIAIVLLVSGIGLDAQVGGLLRRKAADLVKPKPTEPKPAPAETRPAPATEPAPATPAAPAAAASAAAPAPAASADPLDESNLNLTGNINAFVRDDQPVPAGEWSRVPFFGPATTAALKLLDHDGRVAFIGKTGPVIKALVQSEAFARAHADYIQRNYGAADHGLAGVKSMDELMKAQDFAGLEAFNKRQTAMIIVDNMAGQSAADIQRALGVELPMWRTSAQTASGPSKAKYERFVRDGEALAALGTADEQALRRGYAVLKSIDVDGPATEDALYAMAAQAKKEQQQIAWNAHNLQGVVKQQLAAFVAIAGTVDFTAATELKGDVRKFVNPAYEKKGDIWKACFRAGEPATAAARQFAQAWLKELR